MIEENDVKYETVNISEDLRKGLFRKLCIRMIDNLRIEILVPLL